MKSNSPDKISKLIHIGYPKCMSTALQRDFFSKHPDIYYLGSGQLGYDHDWIDDDVSALFEVSLRYESELIFNRDKAKETISNHFDRYFDAEDKKLFCVSSESMSFTLNFDIDPVLKAKRLQELFGRDAKILMITRNQLDLFRSYYFECVRGGYPGYFESFLEYHYYFQFHSIFNDLYYDKLCELYCDVFHPSQVMVLAYEDMKKDPESSLRRICEFVDISVGNYQLAFHNDSSDKKFLQAIRYLNEKFPNNMGNTYFGMVDTEKLHEYWKSELQQTVPAEASRNYSNKMMIIRTASEVMHEFVSELNADYSEEWRELIGSRYRKSNDRLQEYTGIDFAKLGYPVSD